MHPLLITPPPAIAQSLNPYFKPAPTICRRCGTSGDAMFHTLADCEANQQARANLEAGFSRAAKALKGEKATDWSAA